MDKFDLSNLPLPFSIQTGCENASLGQTLRQFMFGGWQIGWFPIMVEFEKEGSVATRLPCIVHRVSSNIEGPRDLGKYKLSSDYWRN